MFCRTLHTHRRRGRPGLLRSNPPADNEGLEENFKKEEI